jgi:hypothetical protein
VPFFSFPAEFTFYISELKRGKKPGEKRRKPQKARKKGEKKGREMGNCEQP